jgi:hypothetical protein
VLNGRLFHKTSERWISLWQFWKIFWDFSKTLAVNFDLSKAFIMCTLAGIGIARANQFE